MPDPEVTLDPSDWSAVRALGHRMLDDMFDHLGTIRERPAWREMPAEVKASFKAPVPFEGKGVDDAYAGFRERVIAVSGSSARMAEGCKETPVDTAIIGIVDEVSMD